MSVSLSWHGDLAQWLKEAEEWGGSGQRKSSRGWAPRVRRAGGSHLLLSGAGFSLGPCSSRRGTGAGAALRGPCALSSPGNGAPVPAILELESQQIGRQHKTSCPTRPAEPRQAQRRPQSPDPEGHSGGPTAPPHPGAPGVGQSGHEGVDSGPRQWCPFLNAQQPDNDSPASPTSVLPTAPCPWMGEAAQLLPHHLPPGESPGL